MAFGREPDGREWWRKGASRDVASTLGSAMLSGDGLRVVLIAEAMLPLSRDLIQRVHESVQVELSKERK